MSGTADFASPLVVAGILLAAMALVLFFWRRARARSNDPGPPTPEDAAPAATEAAYLDSSHIIDGPIIGRTAEREPPVEVDRTGKR